MFITFIFLKLNMTHRHRNSIGESPDSQMIKEFTRTSYGEELVRIYKKGKLLGQGGFARVYEFLNIETKQISAGKLIEKSSVVSSRLRQKLMSEIKIHRSLDHESIVKFEHFFEDSNNVYILLELCSNNSLSELLRRRKKLTEMEVKYYLLQLALGLKYLRSHKVIHRDIKVGNLFLNDKLQLKLGDFGLAAKLEFDQERKTTVCGTPSYMAPEILNHSGHSYEVDVWSFGVLAYTLLIGKPPFEARDFQAACRLSKMNAYSFPDNFPVSNEAKILITSILVNDPRLRPSIDEILSSSFLNNTNIPKSLPLSSLAVPPSPVCHKNFILNEKDLSNPPNRSNLRPAKNTEELGKDKENLDKVIEEPHKPREVVEDLNMPGEVTEGPNRPNEAADSHRQVGFIIRKFIICSTYKRVDNGPDTWVKKWLDYSNKYGVAYLLNDYCIGVFFKDFSKLISDSTGSHFKYQQKNSEEIQFTSNTQPLCLKKKISLTDRFRKILSSTEDPSILPTIYVKKFTCSTLAVFFELTNKVLQVKFNDQSEVIISRITKYLIYINKKLETSVHSISTIGDNSVPGLNKRIQHIKEVLKE
jgi:polo-like kinase 1